MTTVLTLIKLLGGLAMFLYGMEIMGDGLKQGSGNALKNILGKLTGNVVTGLLTGTVVTAIIQSSTATIVLTVGLIGAGILNLRQAVSIVMGANIGTTVTAWIVTLMDIEASGGILAFFKPDTLAPIAMILGIVIIMFIKRKNLGSVGLIAMGFGILFTGLSLMTDAVDPLAESDAFVNILGYFSDMPLLGIVTGLVLTVIVQSSSAMVGILQAMSVTGAMDFNLVYPLIMGINLGTCVTTALVCSIGSSKDAKRTGIVHIVFNTIGTVLFMIVMTIIKSSGGFPNLWDSTVDSVVIATFQTVFNLMTAVVLVPFAGLLVKLSCAIVKDAPVGDDKYPELAALDSKLMHSPTVALSVIRKAIITMAKAARDNVSLSLEQFEEYSKDRYEEIERYEDRLDQFADHSSNFLIELSHHIETERDSREINLLMQCIPNIERVGDYATNFDEMALKMHEGQLVFSDSAKREFEIIGSSVLEILRLMIEALEADSERTARRIEPLEEVIDDMVLMLRTRHTDRLRQGKCNISSGLVFMDALTHLERAADQCSNIALLIIGKNNDKVMDNYHNYIQELHNTTSDQSYLAELRNRKEQYLVPLENVQF